MANITDFANWLGGVDLSNYNEVESSYRSMEEKTLKGVLDTALTNNGVLIVSSTKTNNKHILAFPEAKAPFIKHLEHNYCANMDIESWYG